MKNLIAYFSCAGENWSNGGVKKLKIGNTEVLVEKLEKMITADTFKIETLNGYPDNYTRKTEVAKIEKIHNQRPKLKNSLTDIDDYENIVLAYPNWWSTMPMGVFTFLESYDFSHKTIYPIVTHGGSGFSESINDIKKLCPHSAIGSGFSVNGDNVVNCDSQLESWVNKIELN